MSIGNFPGKSLTVVEVRAAQKGSEGPQVPQNNLINGYVSGNRYIIKHCELPSNFLEKLLTVSKSIFQKLVEMTIFIPF